MAEMTQFDPKTLENAITEEIKARFAAMVPPAAWQGLVKTHIDSFLKGEGKGSLKELVFERLGLEVKKELDLYFGQNGPWGFRWEDGKRVASDEVEKLVMKNMPVIISHMMSSAVQATIEMMRERMGSGRQW